MSYPKTMKFLLCFLLVMAISLSSCIRIIPIYCLHHSDCQTGQQCVNNQCEGDAKECQPSAEVCDQRDNDCDGEIDEGNVCKACQSNDDCNPGRTCQAGKCITPCACKFNTDCAGLQVCRNCACIEPACVPSKEVCDGKDNDCDGQIDEGARCEFALSFGGVKSDDIGIMLLDKQKNMYVFGVFSEKILLGEHALYSNEAGKKHFLAKLAPTGKVLWAKALDWEVYRFAFSDDTKTTIEMLGLFSKTVTISGKQVTVPDGKQTLQTLSMKTSGEISITSGLNINIKKKKEVRVNVIASSDGSYYLFGNYDGSRIEVGKTVLEAQPGYKYAFLAKLDSKGNEVWKKPEFLRGKTDAVFTTFRESPAKSFYTAGVFRGIIEIDGKDTLVAKGEIDTFIIKWSPSFEKQVRIHLGDSKDKGVIRGFGLTFNKQGDLFVSGDFEKSIDLGGIQRTTTHPCVFVAKLDPNLQKAKWLTHAGYSKEKKVGSVDSTRIFSALPTDDGNFYFGGNFIVDGAIFGKFRLENKGTGWKNFFARLNSKGEITWATSVGSGNQYYKNYTRRIIFDAPEYVYFTGAFADSGNFGSTPLSSNGDNDIFIWKLPTP